MKPLLVLCFGVCLLFHPAIGRGQQAPPTQSASSEPPGAGQGAEPFGDFKPLGPDELIYDGLRVKLPPEVAERVKEQAEALRRELDSLIVKSEGIESQLKTKRAEYAGVIESELSAVQLRALNRSRFQRFSKRADQRASDILLHAFLARLAEAQKVNVYEGVARAVNDQKASKLADAGTIRQSYGGYWFYRNPVKCEPRVIQRLASLCLNHENLEPYGGPKFCGGFHPDLCLEYPGEFETIAVMICFGCHEILFVDSGSSCKFDLPECIIERLQTLAETIYQHRPRKPQ